MVLVCAIGALALALNGCGAAHKQSEPQQVTQVLRSYLNAQTVGDGQTACPLLTKSGEQQLIALVVKAGGSRITATPSCTDAVALIAAFAGKRLLASLKTATIDSVDVSGARASAVVTVSGQRPQTVGLTKSTAGWKIAEVPGLGA